MKLKNLKFCQIWKEILYQVILKRFASWIKDVKINYFIRPL